MGANMAAAIASQQKTRRGLSAWLDTVDQMSCFAEA
jgi:hypothetical protein